MSTAFFYPTRQGSPARSLRFAPPKWDALLARSRHCLADLARAVVTEALDGHEPEGLTGAERLESLLGTLVLAYSIGVFSSTEIESDCLDGKYYSGPAYLAPTARELQLVRRAHRELLTHCLARVYALAWKQMDPLAIEPVSPLDAWCRDSGEQRSGDDWQQAQSEARDRVEWAFLSDLVERE